MIQAISSPKDSPRQQELMRLKPLDHLPWRAFCDSQSQQGLLHHLLPLCVRINEFVANQARFDCVTATSVVSTNVERTVAERLRSLHQMLDQAKELLYEGDCISSMFTKLKSFGPRIALPPPEIECDDRFDESVPASSFQDGHTLALLSSPAPNVDGSDEDMDSEDEYPDYEETAVVSTATAVTITSFNRSAHPCGKIAKSRSLRHVRNNSSDLRSDAGIIEDQGVAFSLTDSTTASESSELDEAEEMNEEPDDFFSIVSNHYRDPRAQVATTTSPTFGASIHDVDDVDSNDDLISVQSIGGGKHIEEARVEKAERLTFSRGMITLPRTSSTKRRNREPSAEFTLEKVLADLDRMRHNNDMTLGISAGRRNAIIGLSR